MKDISVYAGTVGRKDAPKAAIVSIDVVMILVTVELFNRNEYSFRSMMQSVAMPIIPSAITATPRPIRPQ